MTELLEPILPFLAGAFRVAIIFGPIAIFFWIRAERRRKLIQSHRAAGTIGPAAFVQGGDLPRQYAALAEVGTRGDAPRTLDDFILRPSVGVRVLVLLLLAMIFAYCVSPGLAPNGFHGAIEELPIPPIVTQLLLLGAALNGVIYIFGAEARYNRDKLITTRMFLSRREFRWKDLEWVGDDGAYELVLKFAKGGKAKVLKHARGIEAFKAFAQEQLRKNR